MKISLSMYRILAIVWTLIILIGCLAPQADIPGPLVDINDKAMHALIFAPFAFLWMQAGFRLLPVLLAGCLFGALIELLQYLLPINRHADWIDFLADCIGTGLGIGVAVLWYRIFPKRNF